MLSQAARDRPTEVREKLEAINPDAAQAVRNAVAEVARTKQWEARESSPRFTRAARDFRRLFKGHRVSERNVHGPARAQNFEKTALALSTLGLLPIDIVERALLDKGTDMILILAKAAGCSWTTTKEMLTMHTADRGLSKQDIENAFKSYELLRRETARRVVKFYERRFGPSPRRGSPQGACRATARTGCGVTVRGRLVPAHVRARFEAVLLGGRCA